MNGIRDEQIEFTSPKSYDDGYPLSQKCTWRFAAPEKKEVHIEFLEMDIENGDVIKIHKTGKAMDQHGGLTILEIILLRLKAMEVQDFF